MTSRSLIRTGLFTAAMVGALGFGTSQAFAAPETAAAEQTCAEARCDRSCQDLGFSGGFCLDRTSCNCF